MNIFFLRWGVIALLLLTACAGPPQPDPEIARFEGLYKKGLAYMKRGNPKMALLALRKAQDLQPSNVDLLSQLGVAYDQTGRSGQALIVWRKAHNLKPASGAISHNFGVALMRQQMLDKAEVAFEGALQDPKFNDRGETYYNLALIQQRRGAFREMVVGLKRVLQMDTNHIPTHQVLADHYQKMRRPDLEEKHLHNILAIVPQSIAILERLADLYIQSGQKSRALPVLTQIQTLAPGSKADKRAKLKQKQILETGNR